MSTPSGSSDPDQTRRDIQQTRADLGETVAALAAKTDVKTHARTKATTAVGELRQRVTRAGQSAKTKTAQLAHTVSQEASQRATAVKESLRHTFGTVRGSVRAGAQTTGKAVPALITSTHAATTKIGTWVRAKPVPVLAATGTAATLAIVAHRLRRFR